MVLETNEHFKMYKSGKNWLLAAITAFAVVGAVQTVANTNAFGIQAPLQAHADDSLADYQNKLKADAIDARTFENPDTTDAYSNMTLTEDQTPTLDAALPVALNMLNSSDLSTSYTNAENYLYRQGARDVFPYIKDHVLKIDGISLTDAQAPNTVQAVKDALTQIDTDSLVADEGYRSYSNDIAKAASKDLINYVAQQTEQQSASSYTAAIEKEKNAALDDITTYLATSSQARYNLPKYLQEIRDAGQTSTTNTSSDSSSNSNSSSSNNSSASSNNSTNNTSSSNSNTSSNNSSSSNTAANNSSSSNSSTTNSDAPAANEPDGYDYDGSQYNGGYRWYENGQLYSGFRFYMGTYYWFNNGVRQNAGWRSAWGYSYYTDDNGRAVQGNQYIDGKAYNFGDDGTFYERPLSGYVYDGSSDNGGYRWYESGQLYTGFRYYMGTYYWFVDGVRQNQGWRSAWGYSYYTDSDGRAVQGWQNIDGQSYYFGDDGTYYMR